MVQTRDPKTGQIFTDYAGNVTERVTSGSLGFGIAQNRVDTGITTTRRTMTFPDGTGPTTINIRLDSSTNVVATPDTEFAYVVINASSDQHADNELVVPPSRDSTTERYTIYDILVKPDGLEISSITPIDRVDYLMSALAGTAVLTVDGA